MNPTENRELWYFMVAMTIFSIISVIALVSIGYMVKNGLDSHLKTQTRIEANTLSIKNALLEWEIISVEEK